MSDGICIGSAIEIGVATRHEDNYAEGITISIGGLPIFIVLNTDDASGVAQAIIDRVAIVLSQSAAACGCDAKVKWICERHAQEHEEIKRKTDETIRDIIES